MGRSMKGHSGVCRYVSKFPISKGPTPKAAWLTTRDPIPTLKWEDINMDFVIGLPRTQKSYDSIWVVVDQLTKSTHFIPVKSTYLEEDYARIFLDKIVCHHGIPLSIISDRGAQFTSIFWRSFQKGLGSTMKFSTTFHPQMDGQEERTIQTLEDMLRECIIDFKGSWDTHLPLVEFAYNNSFYSFISMAPFEVLYGRWCRSPIRWFEVGEPSLLGPELIYKTLEKVHIIRNRLQTAYSRQKSYADH